MADQHPPQEVKHDDEKKIAEAAKKQEAQKKAAEKQARQAAKHSAESPAADSRSRQNLESRVNHTILENLGIGMLDGAKVVAKPLYTAGWMTGGGLVSYALAGLSPFILGGGLATGRFFLNRAANKPFTFKDFRKEYAKGLFSGLLYYPAAVDISATPSIPIKLLKFFGYGAPTFMAADNFVDHFYQKYQTPSSLISEVKKRPIAKIVGEGIADTISETPVSYYNWVKQTKGILPAIVAANWSASYPMEAKYGVSVGTASAYRYFTSKEAIAARDSAKNNKAVH